MTDEYELYKCKSLIKSLLRRNQDTKLALQNYSKAVYNESMKQLKKEEKEKK
jgi:hypothetical protein